MKRGIVITRTVDTFGTVLGQYIQVIRIVSTHMKDFHSILVDINGISKSVISHTELKLPKKRGDYKPQVLGPLCPESRITSPVV
jgi:hypothetical protein